MSAATKVLDGLRERQQAVAEATAAVERVASRRRVAARIADEAEAELRSVYASGGSGDPDPAEVERARDALDRARAEALPAAWEGRDAGARAALLEVEADAEQYVSENKAELVAELTPGALAAAERLDAAWSELEAAEDAWRSARDAWRPLLGALGIEAPPSSPLGEMLRGLNASPLPDRPWPVPVPRGLAP